MDYTKYLKVVPAVALLAVAVISFSCSTDTDLVGGPGQGQLTVSVHDQGAPGITEAWVTFESVQARDSSQQLHDVQGVMLGQPINLATLTDGNQVTLATDALPAGDYVALELTISAITLTLDDDSSVDPLPGGFVKVLLPVNFSVTEGQETAIGVDVPLTAFQQGAGNVWFFNPTLVTTD